MKSGDMGDRRTTVLNEASATQTAVRRALPEHDIAHFAVHAAADDWDVLASYLRVAPDDLNDGYMHALQHVPAFSFVATPE